MAYIRQHFRPMRLLDFLETVEQGSVPPQTVVVTFDDGYVDNYQNALPILEETEVPATIFVTTGNLGSDKEFWWDTLERILLQPRCLPDALQLEINGSRQEWQIQTPEQRWQAHQSIHKHLRSLSADEQEQVLQALAEWAAIERSHRPGYRSVTRQELARLAQSKMIDIGAHTVSHPALKRLPIQDQYVEIMSSRRTLEELIPGPITTFSYPFGSFSNETIKMIKKAGFRAACTTVPKMVMPGDDRFQMGRYTAKNWPQSLFAEKMEEFFYEPDRDPSHQ
jgi:peptidoglycan/xylan/chitin deacetylase (PgdA/CDA1 family)